MILVQTAAGRGAGTACDLITRQEAAAALGADPGQQPHSARRPPRVPMSPVILPAAIVHAIRRQVAVRQRARRNTQRHNGSHRRQRGRRRRIQPGERRQRGDQLRQRRRARRHRAHHRGRPAHPGPTDYAGHHGGEPNLTRFRLIGPVCASGASSFRSDPATASRASARRGATRSPASARSNRPRVRAETGPATLRSRPDPTRTVSRGRRRQWPRLG